MSDDDNELAKTGTGVDPVEVARRISQGTADAPTMAAPPELASPENETPLATPVAYTETGEVPVEDYPQTGPSPVGDDGQRWLSVVGIAGIVISVATAVTVGIIAISLGHKHSPAPVPAPPTSQPVVAPSTSQPVVAAPPLDGTYRLDFDYSKETKNGQPSGHEGGFTNWLGFRSACTPTGCAATATQLDRKNLQAPDTEVYEGQGANYVLHWINGRWQSDNQTHQLSCSSSGVKRYEPSTETLSLEPQPDGTYRGTNTWELSEPGECGGQRATLAVPFVASRTGPPPVGVVADPPTGR